MQRAFWRFKLSLKSGASPHLTTWPDLVFCQWSVVSGQLQRGDAESRASLTAASGLGPKASGASPGLIAGLYDAARFVAKPISNVAAWQFFRSTWGNDPLAVNLRPGGGGCPGGSSARRRLNPGETSWTDIPVEKRFDDNGWRRLAGRAGRLALPATL